MHQNGDRLGYVDAHFGARHDIIMGEWMNFWNLSTCNATTFLKPGRTELDVPYVWCHKNFQYVARLLPLVVFGKNVSGLSEQLEVYTVLYSLYAALSFLQNMDRSWRHCNFERQMKTAHLLVFVDSHSVEILVFSLAGLSLFYASLPKWWSDYESHCELNIPSPTGLTYSSHQIVDEADLREVIWQIAVCKFSCVLLSSFMACALDKFCIRSILGSNIRRRGSRGMLISFPSRLLRPAHKNLFTKLSENSSIYLEHALPAFTSLQKAHWPESSGIGWLPYSLCEGAVKHIEAFTMLGRRRGTDEEAFSEQMFRKFALLSYRETTLTIFTSVIAGAILRLRESSVAAAELCEITRILSGLICGWRVKAWQRFSEFRGDGRAVGS